MDLTAPDYSELASQHRVALTEAISTAQGKKLCLSYEDKVEIHLDAETLRQACRCAWCTRARRDGIFPAAFPDIAIRGIEPFGTYAFNLIFSDGHARGVFPFAYLRSLGTEDLSPQTLQDPMP